VTPFPVIIGANGDLFGGTCYGGLYSDGIAYQMSSAGKETILYNFGPLNGSCPGNIFAWKGELYGVGGGGTYGYGVMFKLDVQGNEILLHEFGKTSTDVRYPELFLQNADGILFGASFSGGTKGVGTIFRIDTEGRVRILYSSPHVNIHWSVAGLVSDEKGNLYGTSPDLGIENCGGGCGTVFKLDTAGNLTTLYEFTGGVDGGEPYGGVVRDAVGNLYGAAAIGGVGFGTVFKLDVSGNETTLYSFMGATDGMFPTGNLVLDAAGNLYGTTEEGGDLACEDFINQGGCGTLFKIDPSGNETIVHTFAGALGDGSYGAYLTMDAAGDIYGTSYAGGLEKCNWNYGFIGCGTVFKLTP
jgi:uncharacterized repeat protein (TIGR03803 family)